jgi:hypothetical protein
VRLAKLASAIGTAIVTTVFFTQVTQGGVHAVTVSVAVVGAIGAVCLGVVWLLPKNAPAEDH